MNQSDSNSFEATRADSPASRSKRGSADELARQRESRIETIEAARKIYGIDRWGTPYFGISANGNVQVNAPTSGGVHSVELLEIINGLKARGLDMPVLLRLENLVDDRIVQLNQAFARAISQSGYQNKYRAVFPIKVNQQSHVIEEIARAGDEFCHGFEAGSKAELLIAMASLRNRKSLLICNGYKDEEFIDLGLQANQVGFNCFFVLETPEELQLILDRAKHWNVEPQIGVRLKLTTHVEGHWSDDSGDRSLFGLTTRQLIEVVDQLKESRQLGCLQLLHFHLGSQIPNIRNIRDGVREACRYYIDLVKEGVPLGYFNLGGGLAVDYDGSFSNESHSRNYTLDEYCVDVVETIGHSLTAHQIPHPVIVSESGRWTVAPMSVLLFNILSVTDFSPQPLPDPMPSELSEPLTLLLDTLQHIEVRRLQENYNDAIYYRGLMRHQFRSGRMSLRERALGENLCLEILNRIANTISEMERPPNELLGLRDELADIYLGKFSVFQSLPDAWAIDQVFPVMPLQRLAESPSRRAIIADLTCDCDGKLHRFVGGEHNTRTLPLHPLNAGEDYHLGVFLVGAYQETLGDLHNLFGDTHIANVRITQDGKLEFVQEIEGDRISDVLSYVEFQPQELYQKFRELAEQAVRQGNISVDQRQAMLGLFSESLRGYTYFES